MEQGTRPWKETKLNKKEEISGISVCQCWLTSWRTQNLKGNEISYLLYSTKKVN